MVNMCTQAGKNVQPSFTKCLILSEAVMCLCLSLISYACSNKAEKAGVTGWGRALLYKYTLQAAADIKHAPEAFSFYLLGRLRIERDEMRHIPW